MNQSWKTFLCTIIAGECYYCWWMLLLLVNVQLRIQCLCLYPIVLLYSNVPSQCVSFTLLRPIYGRQWLSGRETAFEHSWGLFHRQRTGSGSTFHLWEEPEVSVSTGNRVGVEPRSWFGTGTISSLGFSQRTVTTYVGVWLLCSAAGAQRPWNIITLLKGQIYKLTARRSAPLSQLGDHFIFATVSITARHCTVYYKQHVLNIKN